MALLVLIVALLVVAAASLRWGTDSREPHNNWNRG
jgi:hypothetical protein